MQGGERGTSRGREEKFLTLPAVRKGCLKKAHPVRPSAENASTLSTLPDQRGRSTQFLDAKKSGIGGGTNIFPKNEGTYERKSKRQSLKKKKSQESSAETKEERRWIDHPRKSCPKQKSAI